MTNPAVAACGPLPEANARYADNPWVTAVLESIRELA